jgi:hypothetical protein
MTILTAVTRCRETGSVMGKKLLTVLAADTLEDVCDAPAAISIHFFSEISYYRNRCHTSVRRRKSESFICVHSAIGLSMNFRVRIRECDYDFLQLLYI